jgi:kynureninase
MRTNDSDRGRTTGQLRDFARTRDLFEIPRGIVYFDGNSLGPLPRDAVEKVRRVMVDQWGHELVLAWNTAGWFAQPRRVGDRIARLIGAESGSVTMGDTLSIKVYQALASAIEMNPQRRVILSDVGNFPSDLYMAQGLISSLNQGHQLKLVTPERVEESIDTDVAILMLTEVDYRTGRRHDMARLTAKAHARGALVIWDLAHSVGAFPVDLASAGADFAVGCTYKFLNGGPGAPAFIYVAPRHAERARPALSGWMGHDKPFAFTKHYVAASGVERMRVGTPPVLALAALEASLDIWDQVDLDALRDRSIELGDLLIALVEGCCSQLRLVSPRVACERGSQVSFAFDRGYAAMQALIARGVIGDFRAPDIMRFGICPLYNGEEDIRKAAAAIDEVINGCVFSRPEYQVENAVT